MIGVISFVGRRRNPASLSLIVSQFMNYRWLHSPRSEHAASSSLSLGGSRRVRIKYLRSAGRGRVPLNIDVS
jgi:hypothetical protein